MSQGDQHKRFSFKKALLLSLKVGVSTSLLYLVFRKTGPEKIVEALRTIPLTSFIISVILILISVVVATLRWKLFIPSNPPARRLFSYYLTGTFFNTVLPGIVGGDAVKAYYLDRDISDLSGTLASIFFERFLGYVSLIFLCAVSYPFIYKFFAGTAISFLFPTIILAFLVLTFLIFRTGLLGMFRHTSRFHSYLKRYVTERKEVFKGFSLSLLIQCLYVLSVFVLAKDLRGDVQIIHIFAFFPVITTLSSLPISISGLGIRETSFVLLFGAVGWESGTATALSLAWFLSILITGLFGLLEYLRMRR